MFIKSNITSEHILTGNIRTTLIAMTVPTTLALSLNAAFNFIDRLYIAGVGEIEFAALGMAFIIQAFILAIATGIGTGISACLSKAIGAGDEHVCNDVGRSAVFLVVLVSLLTAIIGTASLPMQISILGMSELISTHYKVYLTIIFLGSFSIYAPVIFNSILRGEGNMTIPMHVMVVGALTNLVLDPILIFGFASIPALGIKGAAIATIVARTLATVWAVRAVCKHSKHVSIFETPFNIKRICLFETSFNQVLKKIIAIGLPISLSSMLAPIVLGAYYKILTPYGDASKVVLTMGLTYLMLIMFPVAGLARSVITMCTQNTGANNRQRSSEIYKKSLTISFLFVTCFSCVFFFFDDFFIGVFMNSNGGSEYMKFAILCFAISYPFNAVLSIQVSYLVSQNLSKHVLVINILGILYCALVYIVQLYFGERGVWAGMVSATIISVIHCYLIIFFYVEKKSE